MSRSGDRAAGHARGRACPRTGVLAWFGPKMIMERASLAASDADGPLEVARDDVILDVAALARPVPIVACGSDYFFLGFGSFGGSDAVYATASSTHASTWASSATTGSGMTA